MVFGVVGVKDGVVEGGGSRGGIEGRRVGDDRSEEGGGGDVAEMKFAVDEDAEKVPVFCDVVDVVGDKDRFIENDLAGFREAVGDGKCARIGVVDAQVAITAALDVAEHAAQTLRAAEGTVSGKVVAVAEAFSPYVGSDDVLVVDGAIGLGGVIGFSGAYDDEGLCGRNPDERSGGGNEVECRGGRARADGGGSDSGCGGSDGCDLCC